MEEFVNVQGEKSPETPMALSYPTTDLNGNTQDIINPKRNLSTDEEELLSVIGRKKKVSVKIKKVTN